MDRDMTMLFFYALLAAGMTWSLFNGVVNGWLADETATLTADENPIAFAGSFLFRIGMVVAAVQGCVHFALGFGPDPLQLVNQAFREAGAWFGICGSGSPTPGA